jgi:[protein-PII] uridylyltransferase
MAVAPLGRDELFADRSRVGLDLSVAYTERVDEWLREVFRAGVSDPVGLALVAVGGYGRAELCPQSDIDVMLVHTGRKDIADVAEALWYPIWDEGLKLGHAVRTTKEALTLAADDLDTATSLLSIRVLGGDDELAQRLAADALGLWQKRSKRWLAEMASRVASRQAGRGEVAFLLEPDLKEGRGGLRDVQAIRWAHQAQRVMLEGDDATLAASYDDLLAARVELHRRTGRAGDVLLLQEQDAIAEILGDPDADALMARVSRAARTISRTSDEVWDAVGRSITATRGWRSARDRDVGEGVVLREGYIHLTAVADPASDPVLVLRAAAAAAANETRIDRVSLDRLASGASPLPDPWPDEARHRLVELLLTGPAAIPVIESLDQRGLFHALIPEWEPNRSRPQRNAYHRFTVDRHLMEAAAEAAGLADRVDRPDLLVVGALLHDVGKGYPGDHTDVGMELVDTIGRRLGFDDADVAVLVSMVRLHLLLPDVATRRDLSDDATLRMVADEVGSVGTLRLLGALTEADSLATGPAAWGTWKAELVSDLVRRTTHVLTGGDIDEVSTGTFPTPEQHLLLDAGEPRLIGVDDRLTVVWPDRPGLFSRVAGVLALHGLDVLDAHVHSSDDGTALEVFRVESPFSPVISWERVLADLDEALAGRLAIQARLAERVRTYAPLSSRHDVAPPPPTVAVDNDVSEGATVIEVRAPDAIGLLYRITRVIADLDLDVCSAKVQTLGRDVVDSFYLRDRAGQKIVDDRQLAELERAILFSLTEDQG